MFIEISQNSQENTCGWDYFLIKFQRLWHRCFPENFVKFLKKPPVAATVYLDLDYFGLTNLINDSYGSAQNFLDPFHAFGIFLYALETYFQGIQCETSSLKRVNKKPREMLRRLKCHKRRLNASWMFDILPIFKG